MLLLYWNRLSAIDIRYYRTWCMLMMMLINHGLVLQSIGSTFGVDPFLALYWDTHIWMICGWIYGPSAMNLSTMWFLIPQQSQIIIGNLFLIYAITGEIAVSYIPTLQRDNFIFSYGSSIVRVRCIWYSYYIGAW